MLDLGAQNYGSAGAGRTMIVGAAFQFLEALGLTNISSADATAVGGLVARNDVRGGAFERAHHQIVTAGSDVTVSALETATIDATETTSA